jgi:guanine deaminase
MMPSIKFPILFILVLFGAYAEYEAGKTVKQLKMTTKRQQGEKTSAADHEFMKRALELSQNALRDNHGHPFGSVVVKDGKIIGEGWNKTKLFKDPSAHAEIEAIRDASKKLSDGDLKASTIYTSAQPCPMCLSLIYLAGITKVYYCIPHSKIVEFNSDLSVDYVYEQLSRPENERTIHEVQLLDAEADKYLKSYVSLQ